MEYLVFSFWFIIIHTVAYTAAGMIALKISKDIYDGKSRLMDYLRDMANKNESSHVTKWFIPAQLVRGLLMSIVLYPILGLLGETSFALRFVFLFGLMFIYTHLSCAAPCADNIEGFVYMKDRYFKKSTFIKFQFEMITYSLLFSLLAGWLLF